MVENKEYKKTASRLGGTGRAVKRRARNKDLVGSELPETSRALLWRSVEFFASPELGAYREDAKGQLKRNINKIL